MERGILQSEGNGDETCETNDYGKSAPNVKETHAIDALPDCKSEGTKDGEQECDEKGYETCHEKEKSDEVGGGDKEGNQVREEDRMERKD